MRPPIIITALICVAALAGCGSSGKSSSSTTSGTGTAPSSSQTSSTPAQPAGGAGIKATVAECKRIIQSQSKLPATAKTKLEGACTEAAKGNTQAVKSVAREVCEEVIDKSGVANGAAKETALKACRK